MRNRGDYDHILPMKTPADLKSVTLAEWTELIEKLASDSDYQIVVIDFGSDVCGLYQLLSQCTKVYTPVLPDTDSLTKMGNFQWILKEENFEEVIENIHRIMLPENFDGLNKKAFMSAWAERFVMS